MTDDCNETFKERLWEVFEEFVKVTVPLPVELLLVPVSAKMYVLLPDGVTVNHDRFSVTVSVEGEQTFSVAALPLVAYKIRVLEADL